MHDTNYVEFHSKNDKGLMKLMLECPEYIRRVILSDNQIDTVNIVINKGTDGLTARELANHRNISIQSASAQLTKLWYKGYIKRKEIRDPTGGSFYRYRSVLESKHEQ